jgi:group I intron endonuclease
MTCGIYRITCLVNNKVYIGSSKQIEIRKNAHKARLIKGTHVNKYLQNAYNAYGNSAFRFAILEVCDEICLIVREQFWIDHYKSYDREFGFNANRLADRPTGSKHSEETRRKMSAIKKLQYMEGLITSNLIGHPRKPHTEESKRKLSESRKGNKNPRFGYKEPEDKKRARMANMLAKPRWNTGLTKDVDPRLAKLGVWAGKLPPNAIRCTLFDTETSTTWESNSLKHLAQLCPLSLATINRLKSGNAGLKITQRYRFYDSNSN